MTAFLHEPLPVSPVSAIAQHFLPFFAGFDHVLKVKALSFFSGFGYDAVPPFLFSLLANSLK